MSGNVNQELESEKAMIRSYVILRRAVGVLGMALPLAVSLGAYLIQRTGIQSSVSSYYYTVMRNVFVGALWAIGVFLMFYRGYERADSVASNLGGLFAIGISLFPTAPSVAPTVDAQWIGQIHFAFAVLFFVTLAYMSLFLFTKTHPNQPQISVTDYRSLFRPTQTTLGRERKLTHRKLQRNLVYYACGGIMLVCILFIAIYFVFFNKAGSPLQRANLVFWLEAVAIVAFGASWLTKGDTWFKDKDEPETATPPDAARDAENA